MTTSTNQYKSEHSSCGRAPQASCGTQMTHGQNRPFLIDMERPQFDGVSMKAWTKELWKVGSFWHHLLTGGKKAAGVRERAMLLALEHGVMCGETQKAWPTASTNCTSPASTPLREHPSPSLAWHSVYSHIHLSCPQSAAWIETLWPWWMVIVITPKNKKKTQLN